MSTGVGRRPMMRRTAVMPSMTGISMSMVTTSGLSAMTWRTAS